MAPGIRTTENAGGATAAKKAKSDSFEKTY